MPGKTQNKMPIVDEEEESKASLESDETEEDGASLIKNGTKKIFRVPKERANYLLPLREERMERERQHGITEVDWANIVDRARMASHIKGKGSAYFSH